MNQEDQELILMCKGAIAELPPGMREQCESMVEHLRRMLADAGNPVGPLAFALVGAELQARSPEL